MTFNEDINQIAMNSHYNLLLSSPALFILSSITHHCYGFFFQDSFSSSVDEQIDHDSFTGDLPAVAKYKVQLVVYIVLYCVRGCHGRDCMVVGLSIAYTISAC